ncbi:MAG: aldo/keto reductase [Hyphomicrobiaceae bacterium]
MEKRKLGRSSLDISPLIFGGNVFGWTVDETQSHALLDRFVDLGFNCVDTADMYSRWAPGNQGGESETIIGKWFKAGGKRDKVVLATKCGMEMGPGKKGLSKRYIVEAVEASLKRLQTDVIDLYQSHQDDAETPVEETMEAHASLIKAGKVRFAGASNFTAARLQSALDASSKLGVPRYQTLQPNYSLCERTIVEGDLQKLCQQESISIIPYYSLASGFLTGKYRTEADLKGKARGAGAGKYLNAKGLGILKSLDDVASQTGGTQAQVALAWLMAQPAVAAPIASATSITQLDDIAKAATLKLSAEQIKALNTASA